MDGFHLGVRAPSLLRSPGLVGRIRRIWGLALFLVPFSFSLEIATRIEQKISYGAPLLGLYNYETALWVRDSTGVLGKPYGRFEKWSLNSLGFRGPELDTLPSRETQRVLCLGASETFGLFESPGNEWPRQLEKTLAASGERVEVVNASLAGMTFRRRIQQFDQRLLRLKPQIVLLMLEYPSYVGVARGPEFGGLQGSASQAATLSLRFPQKLKDSVLPRLPQSIGSKIRGAIAGGKVLVHRVRLGQDFQSSRVVTENQVAAFLGDLGDFLETVSDAQAEAIILAPAIRLDEETSMDFVANWPFVHPDWLREASVKFLEAALPLAEKAGVPIVDLDAVVASDRSLMMMDAFHFSDSGAGAVAEAVAAAIEDLPH